MKQLQSKKAHCLDYMKLLLFADKGMRDTLSASIEEEANGDGHFEVDSPKHISIDSCAKASCSFEVGQTLNKSTAFRARLSPNHLLNQTKPAPTCPELKGVFRALDSI